MKVLKLITVILLAGALTGCTNTGASAKTSSSAAELITKVENQEIVIEYPDGSRSGIYTGELKNGKPEGSGEFKTDDDEEIKWVYKGEWRNGLMHGKGKMEWETGLTYEGQYRKGQESGEGTVYENGKELYRGKFKNRNLIQRYRDLVVFYKPETCQFVRLGEVGFAIPENWKYEIENDKTAFIYPKDDNGAYISVDNVGEALELKNKGIRSQIKETVVEECKKYYQHYDLISERTEGEYDTTYELHYACYSDDGNFADVIFYCFVNDGNTYYVTTMLTDTQYDYSPDAKKIKETFLSGSALEKKLAEKEEEQLKKAVRDLILNNSSWDEVTALAPIVSAQEISDRIYKNKMVTIEGVVDNITEEELDLWIPYSGTYQKKEYWDYKEQGIELGEISNGDTIQVCATTTKDGYLDEIIGIKKIDQPNIPDMVSRYKKSCPRLDYSAVMRNPDNYRASVWKVSGTVFQMVSMESYRQDFLLEQSDGRMVYVTFYKDSDSDNILENDYVTVYGTFYSTYSYTSVLGTEKTVPELSADYVDIK